MPGSGSPKHSGRGAKGKRGWKKGARFDIIIGGIKRFQQLEPGRRVMFKRIYVEITNRCNLRCAFCPGTARPLRDMQEGEFSTVLSRLRGKTRYLYFHVMGEPLLHPRLGRFLALADQEGFRVCLTTNGTLLSRREEELLAAPALHKVSVSLHSFEGNGGADMAPYLKQCWAFCRRASERGVLCVLRLWNEGGEDLRNDEILHFLETEAGPREGWARPRPNTWQLGERLYLERDGKFDWPDLAAEEKDTEFCYALRGAGRCSAEHPEQLHLH